MVQGTEQAAAVSQGPADSLDNVRRLPHVYCMQSEHLFPLASRAREGEEALSATGWLSGAPDRFREAMLRIANWRIAARGVEFVHSGVDEGGMFAIARGTAEVSLFIGHPGARLIHIAHPGFWAGNRPLIGRTRQISLVAREEVLWGLFPQRMIEHLLREEPSWWRHIAELFDDGFVTAIGIISDLTFHNSRQRAIAVLLRAAGCRYADPPRRERCFVEVSQADLASMAAMSRNTFSAIIAELSERGLIDNAYRRILLTQPAQLRALLDE
jgi:CRP/FNR family transcriptional regulator, cyclic AMP receptor protein